MKAKFINEIFTEDSDPIRDMHIGGINPSIEFNRLRKNFIEEWSEYLRQFEFKGKKITGKLHKGHSLNSLIEQTTGKIKSIRIDTALTSQYIRFMDEDGIVYFYKIEDKEKLFIEE